MINAVRVASPALRAEGRGSGGWYRAAQPEVDRFCAGEERGGRVSKAGDRRSPTVLKCYGADTNRIVQKQSRGTGGPATFVVQSRMNVFSRPRPARSRCRDKRRCRA